MMQTCIIMLKFYNQEHINLVETNKRNEVGFSLDLIRDLMQILTMPETKENKDCQQKQNSKK